MTLNDKIESALVAIISAAVTDLTVSVVPGKYAADKTLPVVICSADGDGPDDPPGTGNFWINATVTVKASASDAASAAQAKTDQQSLADSVFNALYLDTLAAGLSAAATALTVFRGSVQFSSVESGEDAEGVWLDSVRIRMLACSSSLA
jgi:hypothetical protein